MDRIMLRCMKKLRGAALPITMVASTIGRTAMNVSAAGIAWYHRQVYPSILRLMVDAAQLPPTYDEWRKKAEAIERDLQNRGHAIKRVMIEPDLFASWCREHGLPPDARARSRYAGDIVYMSMLEGE
jgi:hypothetical protein